MIEIWFELWEGGKLLSTEKCTSSIFICHPKADRRFTNGRMGTFNYVIVDPTRLTIVYELI